METTGSILFSILKDLGMEDRFRIGSMQGEWQTLFNEPLSLHTYPVELNNGELLINVDSPVWLQQLKFFKQEMLRKLQAYQIKTIRFKLGRVYQSSAKFSKKIPGMNAYGNSSKGSEPSEDEIAWINQAISGIHDTELKESLKKVMEKAISRKSLK